MLRESVDPPREHHSACRAYVVLQAGRVSYELQDVAPGSLLTPLQQEVLDGPLRSPAELVQSAGLTVRVESRRRDRADDECGELAFWVAGRRLVAEAPS